MSQHDFNIANQGFPAFRSDLNNALAALASNSAGTSEPSTTYAYQFWYDSTSNLLKMRNADDDAWITLAFFDQTNDEWEVRSAVIQAVDSAGVVIKTDDGTTRIEVQDDGDVSIDSGTLFVDATNNRVGVGTTSPSGPLDVKDTIYVSGSSSGSTKAVAANSTATEVWHYVGSGSAHFRAYDDSANLMTLDSSGNLKFNSGYGSVVTAYGCRAWVNFNGTGTVAIRESGNVSSITDNGTGQYTLNFTTAMSDANYSISGGAGSGGISARIVTTQQGTQTSSASRITVYDGVFGGTDTEYVNVVVFR